MKDWDINIYRGVLTGYNEAFIIDGKKKEELIAEDPKSAEIIRPILRGRDIKRYSYDFANLWLINTHNGIKEKDIKPINIVDYPAIKQHLDNYFPQLEKRSDKGDTPYNLRNCAYMEDFYKQKIVWKRIGSILRFSYDNSGTFALDSTCFATGNYIKYLTAYLNSKTGNYLLQNSPQTGTGDLLISVQAIQPIFVPIPSELQNRKLSECVDRLLEIGGNTELYQKILSDIDSEIYKICNLSKDEIEFIEFE